MTGSQFLEGVVGKEGMKFFRGRGKCSFYIKNKLKSEIFFSVITKNLNGEIFAKEKVYRGDCLKRELDEKEGGVFEGR